MKSTKSFALLILSLVSLASGAAAQQLKSNMKEKPRPAQSKTVPARSSQEDFKVLAAGQYSGVEEPFVYIARTPEAYARLAAMVENLPPTSEIDFRRAAVVAAFAGMKPTGGFSVNVRRAGEKISISTTAPGKGMMTTQVITTPFKIAAVPVANDDAVSLNLSAEWAGRTQNFQILKGNFEFSGGFAGIRKTFAALGTAKALTHGDLVTFIFDLKGNGEAKGRYFSDAASGTINAGNIILERVDAGTFVDNPRPPLKASGKINGNKLALNFESHTPMIADGFMGRGMFEAVKSKK